MASSSLSRARPLEAPLEVLWQPRVLMWTLFCGEALALVMSMTSESRGDFLTTFGLASLLIQWVALTTLATLFALRRAIGRLRPQLVAWVALALTVGSTVLVTWISATLVGPQGTHAIVLDLVLRHALLAFVVGLLALGAFQNHLAAQRAAVRAKDAELQALQARIRPHFLFNTLNTAAALVHTSPDRVESLLLDLSDLFRAALAGPSEIPLADELVLVRRYLEIEQMRFGPRLEVQWVAPESLPDIMVPTLSIQPLVENGIRHGIERLAEGGTLEIAVLPTRSDIEVRIRNPVMPGAASTAGHRVGLDAVKARIEAMPGGGRVTVKQGVDSYTASVFLPWSAGQSHD